MHRALSSYMAYFKWKISNVGWSTMASAFQRTFPSKRLLRHDWKRNGLVNYCKWRWESAGGKKIWIFCCANAYKIRNIFMEVLTMERENCIHCEIPSFEEFWKDNIDGFGSEARFRMSCTNGSTLCWIFILTISLNSVGGASFSSDCITQSIKCRSVKNAQFILDFYSLFFIVPFGTFSP